MMQCGDKNCPDCWHEEKKPEKKKIDQREIEAIKKILAQGASQISMKVKFKTDSIAANRSLKDSHCSHCGIEFHGYQKSTPVFYVEFIDFGRRDFCPRCVMRMVRDGEAEIVD